jgi:hypothetical protein
LQAVDHVTMAPAMQIRSLVAAQGMLAVQPLYTTSRQAYKTFCDVELPADVDVQHCPYAHVDSQAGEHLYFVRPQVCCFVARLVPCKFSGQRVCYLTVTLRSRICHGGR